MAKARIKMILNPSADMGNAWKRASDLRYMADSYGEISWTGTVYPGHAKELAKQAAEDGFDLVIAVGGDGTAHEVINGLMQLPPEKRPRFGIVPLGSGNDYAANLGLPKNPEQALHAIMNGKPHKIDLALLEDESGRRVYWDNTVNIGFGGCVNIYSHTLPILRGLLMYFVAVIQTIIIRYDVLNLKLIIDGENWEGETMMITLCNGPREGGGFVSGPNAKMDDGILDYAILSRMSRLMMFRMIPEYMKGTQERFSRLVTPGRFKKMEIISQQPLYLHTDGETFAGFSHKVRHIQVEIIPAALEVMLPAKK